MTTSPATAGEAEPKLEALRQRLQTVTDLERASAVLGWDQTTYMPPGGAEARGRQLATLGRLAHEHFTDPAVGALLNDLAPYEASLPYDSTAASLIRVARRDYQRAIQVPASFVAEMSAHGAATYSAWAAARPANDFATIQPLLEKTLDLSLQYASYFPTAAHPADPLIESADEGMTAAEVQRLFAQLRTELVPLVRQITARPPSDDRCVRQPFPVDRQVSVAAAAARLIGFDFTRGRQDTSPHPFTTHFSRGDVRITTRVNEQDLRECLYATMHEAGHGVYEQGTDPDLDGTPLAQGASSGMHESQSRLWENRIGRSRDFLTFFYPQLQQAFPAQLGDVPLETFYRAVNKVERSLIRVEADEVTYNLHVMLRFDLELAMLEGRLPIKDLPEAWNERFRSDVGLVPPDNSQGVMQDVHWYGGLIGGAFQGYTLGNLLGAQFYAAAQQDLPDLSQQIRRGELTPLHAWMAEHVYQHGRKFTTTEVVQRVTGGPLRVEPLVTYLREKFSDLYGLSL